MPAFGKTACVFLFSCCCMLYSHSARAQDPIVEAVKHAVKKVIKAVDLKVQRMQNSTIDLQNVQKGIENLLNKLRLEDIADWAKKQRDLYKDYFDELWRVKSILTYYNRFQKIIRLETQILSEYKQAYSIVKNDTRFTPAELNEIYTIYSNIISASLTGVESITEMMKSFVVQMSDADRLALINRTAGQLEGYLTDLRDFNRHNSMLSLQRARSAQEVESIKRLYGL